MEFILERDPYPTQVSWKILLINQQTGRVQTASLAEVIMVRKIYIIYNIIYKYKCISVTN